MRRRTQDNPECPSHSNKKTPQVILNISEKKSDRLTGFGKQAQTPSRLSKCGVENVELKKKGKKRRKKKKADGVSTERPPELSESNQSTL